MQIHLPADFGDRMHAMTEKLRLAARDATRNLTEIARADSIMSLEEARAHLEVMRKEAEDEE